MVIYMIVVVGRSEFIFYFLYNIVQLIKVVLDCQSYGRVGVYDNLY